MKILVIISSILIAQTSASFFDVFQGAVLSVQNSFGKMISDVVSDVKETVDCTILAVEHALALSEDAAIRYYNKCGNTINNTVTVTETRHIESSPKEGVSIQYPGDDYLKKEIPAVIDAKINETLTKILGSYNPSEKLRDVENVLAKETKQLTSVSNLVKEELKKVSNEMTSDLKNLTNSHVDPSVDSIMREIKLLENKEQNSKNNSQATEIHQVIDDVLVKLDNIESTEATENVKLEHILKDLEFNSNSSFIDLRQQLQSWKEEESRHLDNIQTKILEHERNAQPNVHNNSLNLPPVQYDSDIRQTNVKEVNIISTKRISNAPRETSFNTSVNARNEQSHTLTLSKPKTNSNGHGNLSGVSSTSTSLKISQTTPNVSKDSDLKITVIRSKSYSMSKSVSISGKVHQAEGTTNSDKSSVYSTTHQPPATMRLSHLDHNKANVSVIISTTEITPTSESNIIKTNYPGTENMNILSTEQPTSTSSIPSDITTINQSDSTTECTKATEIESTTNISIDNSNSTTTSSDLVTEQSSTTQVLPSPTPEEIKTTPTDQPATTVAETTTVSDTTAQYTTESENNAVDSSTLNEKEVSTTTEADQTTTPQSVSDFSIDDTVTTTTSDKLIGTTTVTESSPDYSTTVSIYESTYSQTDQPTTSASDLDTYNVKTTTPDANKENLTEQSTEQSTKPYEEESATSASEITPTTDLSTVSPSEIRSEHSTTLHVTESSSVNMMDSEYTSSTVTTSVPDLTNQVITSTTELSTNSNDEENTTTSQSVTTINPVSITEETIDINTEHTTFVEAEMSTVQTIKTLKPEVSTDNDPELNIEQSTTSKTEEITTSVNPIVTETTTKPDLSTESPEIRTAQTTTLDDEVITTENAADTVTTFKPDLTTEVATEMNTEQSTTCKEELKTVNIVTTTEGDLITESLSERHIEPSTTPYDEEVTNTVKPERTTTSDSVTESPAEEYTEKSTTTDKNHLSTDVLLNNIDLVTTIIPDLITESRSEYHTESNTEQTNNLNEEVATTEVNEVNALIKKYSNDVTTTAPDTIKEHHKDHVRIGTTTVDEELEDLTTVTLPTTTNIVQDDFSDAPTITTSENILESTTQSQNIHTKVHHSESKVVNSDIIEPIIPSVHSYVTASTPLTTTESPYENKDNDLLRTSTQRSRRTRKRNSTRSSRKRNSTTTVTEMPTTLPTTTHIVHDTVITEAVPITIKLLPVFRSAKTAGPPPIADHIHPHKDIPNTYVPHYKERRRPLRRNEPPAVLNEAQQTVNKHEIQSSRHSVVQSGTNTNFPKSVLPDNHEITRHNPMPQERHSRHFDEAPKATEQRHIYRATPHTVTEKAHEATTPREQRSSKRNRTRRLDPVTDSPKPVRERTPETITPANRKRGNRNTRRTNRPSSRSRATTSKPVHAKNSYDMSPADYDAFFNIPPKNSPAHLEAVSRAHEMILNSKRSDLIINSIHKNKERNGARSVFDILR